MRLDVDRHEVFLADYGKGFEPARPTLLFLHGSGMDHSVWPLQARHFAYRGWNSLALDLPGHGRSAGEAPGSIEAMAEWLGHLIAALGADRAHLVGHSMGALIGLEQAARQPERTASIALLGAAPAMPVHPALLEAAGRPEAMAPEMICDWGFGPAGHFGGHRAPGSWMVGHALRLLHRAAGPLLQNDLAACNAWQGGPEAAAKTACPALIVAGRADRMTPAKQAARLAAGMGNAKVVMLDCGHMMMTEQPDETLDALITFFGELPAR